MLEPRFDSSREQCGSSCGTRSTQHWGEFLVDAASGELLTGYFER
jgi:hypothetical protein